VPGASCLGVPRPLLVPPPGCGGVPGASSLRDGTRGLLSAGGALGVLSAVTAP